jgi:hypothetical protein
MSTLLDIIPQNRFLNRLRLKRSMSIFSSLKTAVNDLLQGKAPEGRIDDILSGNTFPTDGSFGARIDPVISAWPFSPYPCGFPAAPFVSVTEYRVLVTDEDGSKSVPISAQQYPQLMEHLRHEALHGPIRRFPDLSSLLRSPERSSTESD